MGLATASQSRAVIVTTDSEGKASTEFQLGYRTGVANHKVKAKVVGYENEIILKFLSVRARGTTARRVGFIGFVKNDKN